MSKISQDSVYWYDAPTNNDFFVFNYENRDINFGDPTTFRFSNAVVTGLTLI